MKNVLFFLLAFCIITVALGQDGEFHLDKDYKVSKTGTIDLGSSDANVFITGSDRNSVHVKIDRKVTIKGFYSGREDFTVDVEEHDGNLRIRERQNTYNAGIITYHKEEYKIEIEAPEGMSLTIRGDDGDYYVKNINGRISMSVDDADVQLAGCRGEDFSFRIDDGDLRMDGGRGNIEIDGDDADIEIYGGAFSAISSDMDDGDLIIETSIVDNGNYYFRTEDGSVNLRITGGGGEFDIDHDDGDVTLQGNFKTLVEEETHTRISLAHGNARVKVRADDARVKLTAQ